MYMEVNINSENGLLKSVILGIASDRGKIKHLDNPKYAEIVERGEDPTEEELIKDKVLLAEIYLHEFNQPDSALFEYLGILDRDTTVERVSQADCRVSAAG